MTNDFKPAKAGGNQPRLSKEEYAEKKRAEKEKVYQMIDDASREIVSDPEKFKSFLDTQSRMDRYSAANALLIYSQYPQATQLKDFDDWGKDNVKITKGAKSISILEPVEYTRADGSPGISYNVKKVFDVTQTNGRKAPAVSANRDPKALITTMLAVVLTVMLSVSTFFIIRNHIDSAKQNEVYDNLAEIVEDEPPKENEGVMFSEDKDYLAEYLELYRQNEDMVGWIKVEDTNINYPVVQSVNEPNFYLKHKFDKTYSAYGCPYVQENCDVQKPSDNIIIYGHHMNDGSMFTGLMKYRNKSFWEEHKTITFDTLTDRHQYEVIAVFKTVVYTNSSDSFKYYEFTDAENAAEFDAYVAKCKELSLYDTGVSAEYGDKLISLSTCEYSRNNGRLVVVAKRVD